MLDGYVKPKINAHNAEWTVNDVVNWQKITEVWMLCIFGHSWNDKLQGRLTKILIWKMNEKKGV